MPGIQGALVSLLVLTLSGAALAQGTRDPRNGSAADTNAATRSRGAGIGTPSAQDTMGGAFRGTGTPNLGTSPGMGSEPAPRRN